MADTPEQPSPNPNRPQRLRDQADTPGDLTEPVDPIEEEAEHGRIGYGRFGEWTPYALAAGIILTIVILAAIDWYQDRNDDDNASGQPTEETVSGDAAPTFQTTLLNGETFDLAAQRGKVVVLNFWGTWCEPCKEEMPALRDLANANPADVVVIGIATNDTVERVVPFIEEMDVNYPVAIDAGGQGLMGDIGNQYKVPLVPATFIIDAEGNIFHPQFGPLPLEDFQTLVDEAKAATAT